MRDGDRELKLHVEDELYLEPSLDAAAIGVAVADAMVTLSGKVQSYTEKQTAERAVTRIRGVRALINELEVELPAESERRDEDIARTATSALVWHSSLPKHRIHVQVSHGWITLSGEVDWHFERMAAERAVRDLMGVRGVSNQITVNTHALKAEIRDRIHEALRRNAVLNAHGIQVTLEGNRAVLTGVVQTLSRRKEAERAAWSVPGIIEVENNIRVA